MKKLIYLFCISLLLISCGGSDDSNNDDQDPQGSFISATINGESYMSSHNAFGVTGLLIENDLFFAFSIAGTKFDNNFDSQNLGITFGDNDFDLVTNGTEFSDTQGVDVVEGHYVVSVDSQNVIDAFSEESPVYVKITSIDKVNRIISGEFNFIAFDENDPNITYNISNGIFNNIQYNVQE